MVAIYRKLIEIGMQAKIATHGGTYEFVLQGERIPYERIEPSISDDDCHHYLRAVAKPWINLYNESTLLKFVNSEVDFFEANNVSAVITGFQLSTALSARSVGIPLVVTHLGSLVPPIFEKEMFACSEYFDNPFAQLIPEKKMNRLGSKFFLAMPFQKRVFNKVAADLSIEPVHSLFDLLMGDLTMVTDVPEILSIPEEEMEGWRPSSKKYYRSSTRLQYAGAIFARLFGNIPEDVRSFLDIDKPKIYVAMASGKKENLQRVYDILSTMDVRSVICSLVHDQTFLSSENVLVADFLPSHLVMPLCNLAIIHGGQGSVQTAISAGIPLIGFPIQPEQNFNLKQVERHGAGLCLSLRSLRKGHLRESIHQILNDDKYKKSMEQLQAWQSSREGALEVAMTVRDLTSN